MKDSHLPKKPIDKRKDMLQNLRVLFVRKKKLSVIEINALSQSFWTEVFIKCDYCLVVRWMTYGIFGKNKKFEGFLIFLEKSPKIPCERFCSNKNAYHWL